MSKAAKSAPKDLDIQKKISGNQKIKDLEDQIAKVKYNKATESAVGRMKAQLAKLKANEELRATKGRGPKDGFSVRKTGDGTAVLLGFPSVGKSTLLNALTGTESAVAAYAFTTLTVIPGLLKHRHAKIQILDVPGIVKGAAAGTGRGKEVLQVIRNADLIMIVIDVFHPEHLDVLYQEIRDAGVRINARLPDVKIIKTSKGGIDIGTTVKMTHLDSQTVVEVLKEYKIINAQIVFREDITVDQLIDVIEANKAYVPAIKILNKIDMVDAAYLEEMKRLLQPDICISGHTKLNLEALKDLIFDRMTLMRVFLKEVNKKPDLEEPLIMTSGSSLKLLCEKLHRDFVDKFKYARIWGPSAKFDGQVKRDLSHVIKDGDIVELHLK